MMRIGICLVRILNWKVRMQLDGVWTPVCTPQICPESRAISERKRRRWRDRWWEKRKVEQEDRWAMYLRLRTLCLSLPLSLSHTHNQTHAQYSDAQQTLRWRYLMEDAMKMLALQHKQQQQQQKKPVTSTKTMSVLRMISRKSSWLEFERIFASWRGRIGSVRCVSWSSRMSIVSLAHGISLEKKHQSSVFTFSRLRHLKTDTTRSNNTGNSWENWQADSFKSFAFLVIPFEDPSLKLLKTAAGIFVRIEAFLEVDHQRIRSRVTRVSSRVDFCQVFGDPHRQLHPNVPDRGGSRRGPPRNRNRRNGGARKNMNDEKSDEKEVTRRRRRDVTATEDAAMPSPERRCFWLIDEKTIQQHQKEHTRRTQVVFVVRVDETDKN